MTDSFVDRRHIRTGRAAVLSLVPLVAASVSVASTQSPAGASDAPPAASPSDSPEEVPVPPRDDTWPDGIRPTADDRPAVDQALAKVLEAIGDRVGIVRSSDGALVVPVVGLTGDEAKQIESVGTATTPVSAEDTDIAHSVYSDALAAVKAAVPKGYDVVLDTMSGTIILVRGEHAASEDRDVAPTAIKAIDQALAAGRRDGRVKGDAQGSQLFRTEDGGFSLADARGDRPVRSGRWLYHTITTEYCTAGFLMYNPDGVLRHTTAGHCVSASNTQIRTANGAPNSTVLIGTVVQRYPSGFDVAAYSIPDGDNNNAAVTLNGDGTAIRRVTGQVSSVSGDYICFAGFGSYHSNEHKNEDCDILALEKNDENGKPLYCIAARGYAGDSGGPMYQKNAAGEALATGTTVEQGQQGGYWWTCYMRIQTSTSLLGYSLAYWK